MSCITYNILCNTKEKILGFYFYTPVHPKSEYRSHFSQRSTDLWKRKINNWYDHWCPSLSFWSRTSKKGIMFAKMSIAIYLWSCCLAQYQQHHDLCMRGTCHTGTVDLDYFSNQCSRPYMSNIDHYHVFSLWWLILTTFVMKKDHWTPASMIFTCACVAHVISAPLISIIWSPGWRRPSLATRPSGNTWKRRKCADLCHKSWRKLRPLGRRHIEEGYRSLPRLWCQERSWKVFLLSIFSILSICIICSISLISNVCKNLTNLDNLTPTWGCNM